MLAVDRAAAAGALNGREVVIAIVGGTMLSLALTRPRLRWVERLTEESSSGRLWAERALTCFSLTMLGYALITVDAALHRQLDPESNALLKGAVLLLVVYGLLVHLEPFIREWRLRGGIGACGLYLGVASAMGALGILLAEVALQHSLPGSTVKLLAWMSASVGAGWIFYRIMPIERAADWLLAQLKLTQYRDSPHEPD